MNEQELPVSMNELPAPQKCRDHVDTIPQSMIIQSPRFYLFKFAFGYPFCRVNMINRHGIQFAKTECLFSQSCFSFLKFITHQNNYL